MAKIEIKAKNPGTPALTMRDLDILVDGRKIDKLVALQLDFDMEGVNEARIAFLVDTVDIDAEALTYLKGAVQNGPRTKA